MCGMKSRGNWAIGYCLKDCAARSKKSCAECVRFSKFKGRKDGQGQEVHR